MAIVDQTLYNEVGRRIYNLRSQHQYTRSYLASQVNISPKFLYEIENGRKGFTVQVLLNLADIFGTSCDYLVRGEASKDTDSDAMIYKVLQLFDNEDLDRIATVLRAVYAVMSDRKSSGSSDEEQK